MNTLNNIIPAEDSSNSEDDYLQPNETRKEFKKRQRIKQQKKILEFEKLTKNEIDIKHQLRNMINLSVKSLYEIFELKQDFISNIDNIPILEMYNKIINIFEQYQDTYLINKNQIILECIFNDIGISCINNTASKSKDVDIKEHIINFFNFRFPSNHYSIIENGVKKFMVKCGRPVNNRQFAYRPIGSTDYNPIDIGKYNVETLCEKLNKLSPKELKNVKTFRELRRHEYDDEGEIISSYFSSDSEDDEEEKLMNKVFR